MNMQEQQDATIHKLFRACIDLKADEFCLKVGEAPAFRIKGKMTWLEMPSVDEHIWMKLCLPMLDVGQQDVVRSGSADFAYAVEYRGIRWRFRVTVFTDDGVRAMTARRD